MATVNLGVDIASQPMPAATSSKVFYGTVWGVWTAAQTDPFDPDVSEDLLADSATWSCAPTTPTARLRYVYGSVMRFGDLAHHWVAPIAIANRFIRIDYSIAGVARQWFGIAELDERFYEGIDKHLNTLTNNQTSPGGAAGPKNTPLASGEQMFTAYGLDRLLRSLPIAFAKYDDGEGNGAASIKQIDRALGFNFRGKPNRSAAKNGGSYLFDPNPDTAQTWSSADIVEYLVTWHLPKQGNGNPVVPIGINDPDAVLRTWDAPEFEDWEIQDRVPGEIIDQLLTRERLAGWYIDVVPATFQVSVRPFSFASNAIPIGGNSIPANSTKLDRLVFDADNTAVGTVKRSELPRVDQVVARGRRARMVGTFSFADGTLDIGWPAVRTTEYNQGASTNGGYAALGLAAKRQRNDIARGADLLRDVYARFQLVKGWGNNAVSGGGDGVTGDIKPGFPTPGLPNVPLPVFDSTAFVQQTLPLDVGVNYAGPLNAVDLTKAIGVERPPLVLWKRSWDSWQPIESAGLNARANRTNDDDVVSWSATVNVEFESRGFRVDVQGEPQHVLAAGGPFVALPADPDAGQGNYETDLQATLAIEGDHYCEGKWPTDAVRDANANAKPGIPRVQIMTIRAGEGYKLDYIVPNTVVGVDDWGTRLRSDGGYVQDNRITLEQIAQTAFNWYSVERHTLSLATDNDDVAIVLGGIIDNVGTVGSQHDKLIEGVVTEITITESFGVATPPRLLIQTSAGELNPLRLGRAIAPRHYKTGGFHKHATLRGGHLGGADTTSRLLRGGSLSGSRITNFYPGAGRSEPLPPELDSAREQSGAADIERIFGRRDQ